MASVIDFSSLTLNPEEARESSQAIFERVYEKGDLGEKHLVITGIERKEQIPFYGKMGLVGKKSSGCTPNAVSGPGTSEKYWDPELVDFRLSHCQGDVPQLLKMWKRSRKALGTWEDVDNEMVAFIEDRGIDANMEAIYRITSFGDEAAANVTSGGQITDGVDTGYFSMLDGLWKQIFAGVASSDVVRYEITENGQATKSAQLTLGDTVALDAMRYLHENIDSRAHDSALLKYQITRSLWNNWWALLEDKSLANAILNDVESAGSGKMNYRGIPIVVRNDWDRNIKAYQDLSSTYYLPHRAILTTVDNIPVGTSDEESMKEIDSFYDKKDKMWYFDGATMLDCKMLEEYMIAAAY